MGNKDFLNITAIDTNPRYAPDANYFQKMSNVMDKVRDRHLIAVIADALNRNDKVMVVYGDAHQYKSEPVFEKMFRSNGIRERLILNEEIPKPEIPAPSNNKEPSAPVLPRVLKYGGFALFAAAGVAALMPEVVSAVAIGLLLSGVVAFAGGAIAEHTKPKPKAVTSPGPVAQALQSLTHSPAKLPQYDNPGRSDGQSWVNTSAKQPERISRAV